MVNTNYRGRCGCLGDRCCHMRSAMAVGQDEMIPPDVTNHQARALLDMKVEEIAQGDVKKKKELTALVDQICAEMDKHSSPAGRMVAANKIMWAKFKELQTELNNAVKKL